MLGSPEGELALYQAVVYLATAPKSNALYMTEKKVRQEIRQSGSLPVPLHLRNAPTKLMKQEGYAQGYKYPHDFEGHFVQENYFPQNFTPAQFYFPTTEGKEGKILERLKKLWNKIKKY